MLCPVEHTEWDFVEPPKISHKKKTEKERERERQERELALKAVEFYRTKQREMGRPVDPREPLKRTADNNWVHVTCAVWTSEVKFGNAKALGPSEGVPTIPRARFAETCKVCKKKGVGACVSCHQCKAPVHVECAHQAGYLLGFDVTPIKGSRRDQFNIVSLGGERGTVSAGVWCKEHLPIKTMVHRMHDRVEGTALNALQLFVQNFKQADLALTGCARKANQISMAAKMTAPLALTNAPAPVPAPAPASASTSTSTTATQRVSNADPGDSPGSKVCRTCGCDVSPKWHRLEGNLAEMCDILAVGVMAGVLEDPAGSHYGYSEALKFFDQRRFQCHKCNKAGRKLDVATKKELHPQPAPEPTAPGTRPATHEASPPTFEPRQFINGEWVTTTLDRQPPIPRRRIPRPPAFYAPLSSPNHMSSHDWGRPSGSPMAEVAHGSPMAPQLRPLPPSTLLHQGPPLSVMANGQDGSHGSAHVNGVLGMSSRGTSAPPRRSYMPSGHAGPGRSVDENGVPSAMPAAYNMATTFSMLSPRAALQHEIRDYHHAGVLTNGVSPPPQNMMAHLNSPMVQHGGNRPPASMPREQHPAENTPHVSPHMTNHLRSRPNHAPAPPASVSMPTLTHALPTPAVQHYAASPPVASRAVPPQQQRDQPPRETEEQRRTSLSMSLQNILT